MAFTVSVAYTPSVTPKGVTAPPAQGSLWLAGGAAENGPVYAQSREGAVPSRPILWWYCSIAATMLSGFLFMVYSSLKKSAIPF